MIVLHSAVMVNSTIVFAVFALLLVPSLIVAEWERNIYVQSTGGIDNESCWNDETPCATINFALKGVKHDSTVIFVHPGTYKLHNGTETQLRGKSQVGIIGLSIPDNIHVSCSPFTGLSFTMTENIILENLTFHGCGGLQNRDFNKQSFTFQVAVFMLFCKNIQINNVVIKSSIGTGLAMYNTVGNVSIWGSKLIDNGLKGQKSLNQFACGGGGMKIEFLVLNTSDMHTESTYITNTNYTIRNSVFLSNKATSHYSCFLEHNSYGGGLSIILRGQASNNMFIIDSNVIEGNNADNGGGLYISTESEISVFIRNTNISSNTAFTGLAVSLINNGSHSGDNYYEISNSKFIENSPKCKINEQSSSGTIFADGINLNFSGYILIERNYASGLKAKHQTKISVNEKSFVNFEENNGVVGGAIALFDCSYVVVYPNTQLKFTNNYVSDKGGAIYSGPCTFNDDNVIPASQCFIQYYRPHIHPDEWEDVNFHFISNTYISCIPHYDEYDYYANVQYVEYIVNNAISAASLSLCWWPSLNSSSLTPDDIDNTLCWNNWYYSPDYCSVSEDYNFVYNTYYRYEDDVCSADECRSNQNLTECRETVHYDTCEDGQAVPINSFQLSCYDCDSTSLVYGWLIFMFVQILPITLLVLLIITLNINLTQGSASGYIFYCQLLSTSFPGLKTGYPAWLKLPVRETNPITFLPFSIWNLNFLTVLPTCISYPLISEKISNGTPAFITCSMDQLGAISFWYLIAAYPMVLLILLYIWLMMYEKGFMCVVYITRPIHRLLARFWHMFDIEPSLIHSIASVYVLCFMQFTATSLKLLNVFYINSDGNTFYYDHSLHYFGWPHSLAGLFAITILIFILIVPTLYVLFYPFKWFQRLFSKLKLNKQLLVALADVFTGPYKDGSDNSKDYRWFAGLYLLLRVVFSSLYLLNHFSFSPFMVVGLQLVLTLLITIGLNIFRPYKRTIHNFSETSLWLLLSITNALKLTFW